MTFVIFFLVLVYGVLSGPGMSLARPHYGTFGPGGAPRTSRYLRPSQVAEDQEFVSLVLYTGLAFLYLAIAIGISATVRALGG